MAAFALAHPWLTALLIVPAVIGGVVSIVKAVEHSPVQGWEHENFDYEPFESYLDL